PFGRLVCPYDAVGCRREDPLRRSKREARMLQQWRTEAVQNSRAGTGCTSPSYASSISVRAPQ
ncbi:MAG: hypothetical protein M3317_01675, partial [Actinomycetota bacterium]|nr:hypothetical protein [Actinomycetota bacterium]